VTTIPLPIAPDTDPSKPTLDEAMARVAEELEPLSASDKLMRLAGKTGNFADAITADHLVKIGIECVEDYERDKLARKDWQDTVTEALESAAQTPDGKVKEHPFRGASNVKYPLLTTAALQFNARMYPAVVKGDEAVLCKVIGQDNGRPMMIPGDDGQMVPMPEVEPGPDGQMVPVLDENGEMKPKLVGAGKKAKRARRVSEYLNTILFYRMEDWESDTDALLIQLPIVGCVFRKLWWDAQAGMPKAAMVSALRIFVPEGARSCDTTPRLTEEIPDVYPHQISERIRADQYIDVDLFPVNDKGERSKDDEGPRLLLEQHRLMDLDEDGVEEPYIVTVDHLTQKVLRIEANFGPEDVKANEAGDVVSIRRGKFYVKYDLFPHPEGKFYGIGLGHLLKQLGKVINASVNQLLNAGYAQTAGGGFIGSGVRLQARGGGSVIRMQPGEFRTVDVPGDQLRNAIVERTLPNVSPVTFQVLELILGAARDISGAKDVITGEASNNGQVGTTLALIEQGLQVFNATAKRTFRALKDEYTLLKENVRKYGGDALARDYAEVLDDPEADFEADFNSSDMDIRPVSDPSNVTRMQRLAKGQFLLGTMEQLAAVGGDAREVMRRVYEAADVEDIDKLLPAPKPQPPAQPNPVEMARAQKDMAAAQHTEAKTGETVLDIERKKFELGRDAFVTGAQLGAAA
jgi:chaperonin GroES